MCFMLYKQTKMKLSNFNGYVNTKDGVLVYNTRYMNAIKVDCKRISDARKYLNYSSDKELLDCSYLNIIWFARNFSESNDILLLDNGEIYEKDNL